MLLVDRAVFLEVRSLLGDFVARTSWSEVEPGWRSPPLIVRAALLRGWQHGGSVHAASHSAVATANASVGGRQFAAPLSSRGTIVRATRRRRLERCAVRKGSSAPRRSVPTRFQFGVSSLLKLNHNHIYMIMRVCEG